MESFVFDVKTFFGEPKANEQTSNVIVDPRKHLKTLKILEMPNKEISAKQIKQSDVGGAIKMGKGCKKEAGAIKIGKGGALAFNEDQLMSELSSLKKGGSLTGLVATVIPALIELAPQIINSIKSAKKSGGAVEFGGASFIFLQGIDAANYDEMLKLFKAIERQKKNLIRESGGAIKIGSGKMGEFFKKSWNNLKSFYANNKDRLKPITDILLNSATKTANKYIDKGVNYVANKTNSDTIKQISNVVGNMAKDTVNNTIEDVRNYEGGGSYDINNIGEENKTKVNKKKSKKIIVSTDNNQNHVTENIISRKRVY